ncbi:MAG: hypothetical protein IKB41_01800 [Clostridia bacterium]|nr:hypothetical protein [Clostridia bacterium]
MTSVFKEIEKLREDRILNIINAFPNRYTVLCQEPDKTKTAYCFSVPIRNVKTNNIVDLCFSHNKQTSKFVGSDATLIIDGKASLFNQHGKCDIIFQNSTSKKTKNMICLRDDNHCTEIYPTLNGMLLIMDNDWYEDQPQLTLYLDRAFQSIRANDKYFSVMREKFVPFVTASCIGVINSGGEVIAPCKINYQKLNDLEYLLTFSTLQKTKNRIAIEINMQETKLFQDTTVESKHPKMNNAFGGISFLGESKEFGEQWLYSRLQILNIPQFQSKKILEAVLHIPKLGRYTAPLTIYGLRTRFCSFGSNWNNKIAITTPISQSFFSNGYYHFNMTDILGNFTQESENFIIKANQTNKPAIIPTGDSFYAPQILEVHYQ